jgi:uroporphyrinogen-III synthase
MAQLIVTRPAAQAAAWAQALGAAGHQVQLLPMIDIARAEVADDAQAYQQAAEQALQEVQTAQTLHSPHVLMFVSSNAVEHFFDKKGRVPGIKPSVLAINLIANQQKRRYWATGPGTVQALLAAGINAAQIDAPPAQAEQWDSEALWQIVRPQISPGQQVLIVRGRDVGTPDSSRDWLSSQVQAAGGLAASLVVYERRAPVLSSAQLAQCQAWLQDGSWWVWSSSQALRHLSLYLQPYPHSHPDSHSHSHSPVPLDVSRARCICTHARIAQAAQVQGFATVLTCKPTPQAVAASIESLL